MVEISLLLFAIAMLLGVVGVVLFLKVCKNEDLESAIQGLAGYEIAQQNPSLMRAMKICILAAVILCIVAGIISM